MSRAFVKEDSQQEPVQIPPRAPLPDGATNYVTLEGLDELQQEKEALEKQKAAFSSNDEDERRREMSLLNGKLQLLQERIDTARIIEPGQQPQNEVRFGATVKLELNDINKINEFQIVGVDQADFKKGKISFLSPVARAITGCKVGEVATLNLGNETRTFKILEISY